MVDFYCDELEKDITSCSCASNYNVLRGQKVFGKWKIDQSVPIITLVAFITA